MRTTRSRVTMLAAGAVIMLILWVLSACERQKPTRTAEANVEAGATIAPTPPQISMTQEVLDKMIADALIKAQSKPTPQPVFTPNPEIMANVSEQAKLREGYVLADPDGKKFLRIYRKDGHPITEGLTSDTIAIEAWKQPIYTNMGDGTFDIVFKERTEIPENTTKQAVPTPTIFASPTAGPMAATPAPVPSVTEHP